MKKSWVLAGLASVTLLSFLLSDSFWGILSQRGAMRKAEKELEQTVVEVEEMRQKISNLENNPHGYEQLVRQELGYMRPGERSPVSGQKSPLGEPMAKTIYVTCSFCEGLMEIDTETGKVIDKWPAGEKGGKGDKMSSALQKLDEAKKRRADLFNVKKEEMETQKKKTEDAFKKEVEKAKKEGVTENPIRPFDLD